LVNGNFLNEDEWRGMMLPHRSTELQAQAMYRRDVSIETAFSQHVLKQQYIHYVIIAIYLIIYYIV
jgi:hypothetical protein